MIGLFSNFTQLNNPTDMSIYQIQENDQGYFFENISGGTVNTAETIKKLKEVVGENRLMRIFQKQQLGLQSKVSLLRDSQLELTGEIIHKIFIGLMDTTSEDMRDENVKLSEIFQKQPIVRAFLDDKQLVNEFDRAKSSGKGFQGLKERIWTILSSSDYQLKSPEKMNSYFYNIETLSSRLIDREPPEGTLIYANNGYFYIDRVFAKRGVYVAVLKPSISKDSSKSLIICRGTATRLSATGGLLSGLNNILLDVGFRGIKSIWPDLKDYLKTNNINNVSIIGKSQGGAQAQYLTTLIAGTTTIKSIDLHTYASIGVSPTVQKLFNDAIEAQKTEVDINILRNSGPDETTDIDYIPTVGGPHLYLEGRTQVFYITPKKKYLNDFIPEAKGIIDKILKFLGSFKQAHLRQTTLKKFYTYQGKIHNLSKEINKGTRLEPLRLAIAKIFNFFTLGLINGESFETFYSHHRAEFLKTNSNKENPSDEELCEKCSF